MKVASNMKAVKKDKAIGGLMLAACMIIAVVYALFVIFPAPVASLLGMRIDASTGLTIRLYAVLVLVFIALIAILAIGGWLGYREFCEVFLI
jgi:hypothetical protein